MHKFERNILNENCAKSYSGLTDQCFKIWRSLCEKSHNWFKLVLLLNILVYCTLYIDEQYYFFLYLMIKREVYRKIVFRSGELDNKIKDAQESFQRIIRENQTVKLVDKKL